MNRPPSGCMFNMHPPQMNFQPPNSNWTHPPPLFLPGGPRGCRMPSERMRFNNPQGDNVFGCRMPSERMRFNNPQGDDVFGYKLNQRPSNIGQFRPNFQPRFNGVNRNRPNRPWKDRDNAMFANNKHLSGSQSCDQGQQRNNYNQMWKGGKTHNKKNQKKNNNKQDKRDLAENNRFYCDTCDRGYRDEDKYQEHINQHQKCKYDDCSYIAHPKLVQLHISLQHKSGLAKKIWQLESKEDIEKWRNDRKRNFPTAENIARKMAERQERIDRGEILETKSFGKMKQKRNGTNESGESSGLSKRQQRQKEWREKKRQRWLEKQSGLKNSDETGDAIPAKKCRLHDSSHQTEWSGDPLSVLADSKSTSPTEKTHNKINVSGALGSLMISYDDSDEEENEGHVENGKGRLNEAEINNNANKRTNESIEKEPKEENQTFKRKRKQRRNRRNKKGKAMHEEQRNAQTVKKSTLLEKLLAPEIRHERNVILQCVYHIVKNNFFGKAE